MLEVYHLVVAKIVLWKVLNIGIGCCHGRDCIKGFAISAVTDATDCGCRGVN
jgi:hypothetical protein